MAANGQTATSRLPETLMKPILIPAASVALLFGAMQASAQSITFNFQDSTDQGFGTGFGNDASAAFPITNIGGSLRLEVLDTASFQQAGRESQGTDAFLNAM